MTSTTKSLAKSLHTVTVLVRLARMIRETRPCSNGAAVAEALRVLGYDGADDPYGLAAVALAQLGGEG